MGSLACDKSTIVVERAGRSKPVMDRTQRKPPEQPTGQPHRNEQEARRAREAEALRANLKRRKEQARARKSKAAFAPDRELG
jgi:hypothetical protein